MAETLKPCPFCGREARFFIYGDTACGVVCKTCHCGTTNVSIQNYAEAVELWNRRAERTCRAVMPPYEPGVEEIPVCSECGKQLLLDDDECYCPRCGAKVVGE